MKILDLNVLIYAHDTSSPRHESCNRWLELQLGSAETTAFAWSVVIGFVRLTTNPRVVASPLAVSAALDVVRGWFEQPGATIANPTDRHLSILHDLLDSVGTAGNLVSDAHLAALAIEHGAQVVTCDLDFRRFPGIEIVDPVAD